MHIISPVTKINEWKCTVQAKMNVLVSISILLPEKNANAVEVRVLAGNQFT